MKFVFVSFLFLVDDFDLSVSSVTRNRADQPIRPSAARDSAPRGTLSHSRAFTAMGLWSYYLWDSASRDNARSAIAIPILFEPKRERICLAPKALSHASLGHRPRNPIVGQPTPKAFGGVSSAGGFSIPNRSESRFQRRRCFGVPRILGRCPRLALNAAPLALNRYALASVQKILGSRLRCGALALGAGPKVVRPKSHWRKRPRAAQCVYLGTVSRKPKGESVGLRGCE